MKSFFHIIFCAFALSWPVANLVADNDSANFDHIKVEFELVNSADDLLTEKDFAGHYVLLAFGFTHCAHICPMMAANMSYALKAGNHEVLGVFVSVDSERDTPQITQKYASSFHHSLMGLSGSYEQIRTAADNFGVKFVVTKSNAAYTVEHSSDIFLIGPDGVVIDVFALSASANDLAAAIAQAQNDD